MRTEVEFVGFAEGCRVQGKLDLEDARLADLLNRQSTIVVRNAVVVRTQDGHRRRFKRLEIGRDELDVVVASGPRGDPKRRQPTRSDCVAIQLGSYCAEGYMHMPRGTTPVISDSEPAMVALTDAILEYQFRARSVSEWFRTVLVNRDTAIAMRTVAGARQEVGIA